MDKVKVQEATKELKDFFEKKKVKISECKEVMFRLLDYIDTHYEEDERDVPFKNGNGLNLNGLNGHTVNNTNNYKDKPLKKNKLEAKTRLLIR